MGAQHAETFTEKLVLNPLLGTFWREKLPNYSDDKTERIYKQYSILKKDCIVEFHARQMPGCCGILVVYYLRPQRVKGQINIFKSTIEQIVKIAKESQY